MEAGARLVSIDPRFSRTAAKADQWISLRPGTDVALIMGMIAAIREAGLIDEPYVTANTNAPSLYERIRDGCCAPGYRGRRGNAYLVWDEHWRHRTRNEAHAPGYADPWMVTLIDGTKVECRTAYDAQEDAWADFTPENAAEMELPVETIRSLGREYALTDPASIILGQGAQRYYHGHTTFRAAMTLGALCGKIGKPHAGVHWMDGPLLRMIYNLDFTSDWVCPGGKFGGVLPGTRMVETIARGDPYPVKSLWLTNYGFGTQSPIFKRFVREALPQLELFAVTEQVMTPAAEYADIVLPCVSYFEEELDIVPGGEIWFLQLRQRAVPPVGVSRSDWEIFAV